ncbi:hypothetical protein HN873_068084 [Arachis hypogaea]
MAALSVRVATSTLCNLNGSQRRQAMLSPVWYMGARPKPSNATATSSSHSHFFQSSRTNISSSKVYHLHHKTPRNLSVFAMSADGITCFFFLLPCFLNFVKALEIDDEKRLFIIIIQEFSIAEFQFPYSLFLSFYVSH